MGHISANAGPHQLHWGDKEMKIACKYLVQENVVGLKPDKSDHLLQPCVFLQRAWTAKATQNNLCVVTLMLVAMNSINKIRTNIIQHSP